MDPATVLSQLTQLLKQQTPDYDYAGAKAAGIQPD